MKRKYYCCNNNYKKFQEINSHKGLQVEVSLMHSRTRKERGAEAELGGEKTRPGRKEGQEGKGQGPQWGLALRPSR